MAEALPTLETMALQGEVRHPEIRLCRIEDAIVVDLGDEVWRAVVVTKAGWQDVAQSEAPLIRPEGMRPMPMPVRDPNALANLQRILNLGSATDLMLVTACMVAALWPTGPYPVLAIDGEQGSGKSTACRVIRRLIDPNVADLRAMPRGADDLVVAARNGRMIAADNVSNIGQEMADALCRVATGAGLSKRALFTDGDEYVVHVCRPVLLNGIPSLLARGDLADRAIAITLPPIADDARRTEAEIMAELEAAAPGIFALLLDGVAMALRTISSLKLSGLPRMADFTRLACAAAPAFGWTVPDMLVAIKSNREAATQAVVEGDPVAEAVRELAHERGDWSGTPSALLDELGRRVSGDTLRDRVWPKDATRLSTRLRRVMPALRRVGVMVDTGRDGHARQRRITIAWRNSAETASSASAVAESDCDMTDLAADAHADAGSSAASAQRPHAADTEAADALGMFGGRCERPRQLAETTDESRHADAIDADLGTSRCGHVLPSPAPLPGSGPDSAVSGLLVGFRRHTGGQPWREAVPPLDE